MSTLGCHCSNRSSSAAFLAHRLDATIIFVGHLEFGSSSFRVIKLLRQSARFSRAETPVNWIGQKLGH
jgi:hypothetical protein